LFIALVLQTTVINRFGIFGVFPNLIIILAFSNAMVSDSFSCAVYGFVCGLMLDLLSSKIIGLNAILVTYLSLVITVLKNKLVYLNSCTVFVSMFIMTVIYQSLFVILNYTIWNIGVFWESVGIILIEALLNSTIALIGYKLIRFKRKTIIK
jgi:rod shape-determining protein MreD